MDNAEYWEKFYSSDEASKLTSPSDFAVFTDQYLIRKHPERNIKLLDLGCGNGRDTFFFHGQGYSEVRGIDIVCPANQIFTQGDVIENIQKSDVFYLRFFAHAIEESLLDQLLEKICELVIDDELIFIETRSTKGSSELEKCMVNFKSSIGEIHFRMLYSLEYLRAKVEKNFTIIECTEGMGLAVYEGEDPFVIRLVLGKL